ncbi:POC1 centriolar protein A [Ceratobasidium sp. 392]|nr:POC1 centriolar protein A [Ceratobasidium sp. 392]
MTIRSTARQGLSLTGEAALQLLRLTAASADAFPALKSAAGGALHIAELVKKFRSNKDEWQKFGEYIQDMTASVVHSLTLVNTLHGDTKSNLEKHEATLDKTKKSIEVEEGLPVLKRVGRFLKDPEMIANMKSQVDETVKLFQLTTSINTTIDVRKTFEEVVANTKTLSIMAEQVSTFSVEENLRSLNVIGDWNSSALCMENTRVELIKRIFAWIDNPTKSGGAEIMVLTAAAGVGKSTVARTIAHECNKRGQLLSWFCFDSKAGDRRSLTEMLTAMANNLSRLDNELAKMIHSATKQNRFMSALEMFQKLVLEPCQALKGRPVTIVIDALDEAILDDDLFAILSDHASQLPSGFRVFVTSRMWFELGSLLLKPHVQNMELDIRAQSNLEDISLYISTRLRGIADHSRLDLESGWPNSSLLEYFISRADGLFLWAATVCDYLKGCDEPTKDLRDLVSASGFPESSPEQRMVDLYTKILNSLDWTDRNFVKNYQQIMGAAIATKAELSITTLEKLYQKEPLVPSATLKKLSPLLTGTTDKSQPVRVLHRSLRNFLIAETVKPLNLAKCKINVKEHNQQLALLCLRLVNADLNDKTPGTGYLAKETGTKFEIPVVARNIPEALRYACQFWHDHVCDTEILEDFKTVLEQFMAQKLILWMELVTACGHYRGLGRMHDSVIEKYYRGGSATPLDGYDQNYAKASLILSNYLRHGGRREEALAANEEAVTVYRLGKEALESIEEAVALYRQLEDPGQPAKFIPQLAQSLQSLSNRQSDMGHLQYALNSIDEAVKLRQQLAQAQSAESRFELALSLAEAIDLRRQIILAPPSTSTLELIAHLLDFTACLRELNRNEEARLAAQEAAQLAKRGIVCQPAEFSPLLALSLSDLSIRLSKSDCDTKIVLRMIQQAIRIYQHLARNQPAEVTPVLALSLCRVSDYLMDSANRSRREYVNRNPNNLARGPAGSRMNHFHRNAFGLKIVKELILAHQQLASVPPAESEPTLEIILSSLTSCLLYLGRNNEALDSIKWAVQISQRLAAGQTAEFIPGTPRFLGCLFKYLLGSNDNNEPIRQVVGIHRRFATYQQPELKPTLSESLDRLSNCLTDLGHSNAALEAIQEVVKNYRQLSRDRSTEFAPFLGLSLDHLTGCLLDLGRNEEPLSMLEEAVHVYQQLTIDRSAEFEPLLAKSLHSLSNCLSNLGRREEALSQIQKAVYINRGLTQNRPTEFASALASSLFSAFKLLNDLDRREEALPVIQEVAQMYQRLAPKDFMAKPYLAISLRHVYDYLLGLDRQEEALLILRELVQIGQCDVFKEDFPPNWNPRNAYLEALGDLYNHLSNLGCREEVLQAILRRIEEGVLFEDQKLSLYAELYRTQILLGHDDDALQTVEKMADYSRKSFDTAEHVRLSICLSARFVQLYPLGRHEEALVAIEAVIRMYQLAHTLVPSLNFSAQLDHFFGDLAFRLHNSGHRDNALVSIREAITRWRQNAVNRPAAFNDILEGPFQQLSGRLEAMG